MTRVQLLLLALLVGSALFLVKTSYESRRLFAAVEKAEGEGRRTEQEFKRLEAERQLQATNQRVEREAKARLRKHPAQPAPKHYVIETSTEGSR